VEPAAIAVVYAMLESYLVDTLEAGQFISLTHDVFTLYLRCAGVIYRGHLGGGALSYQPFLTNVPLQTFPLQHRGVVACEVSGTKRGQNGWQLKVEKGTRG